MALAPNALNDSAGRPVCEKKIRIAAQLYEMRRLMRSLLGDKYLECVKPYQELIRMVQEKLNCDVLEAATKLGNEAKTNGYEVIRIMTAAVEMIEPST